MKRLHRPDLYAWSVFDEARNIDFHSVLWVRENGNLAIDPLPMSPHDEAHLDQLGSLAGIVVTNSDHVRGAQALAARTGAELMGPARERNVFPFECDRWLEEGDEVGTGLAVLELHGSKTPGELALVLERTTLICGDLIRAHEAGKLCLLPDAKLADKAKAIESLRRIAGRGELDAVLPGDGWPVFRGAAEILAELAAEVA